MHRPSLRAFCAHDSLSSKDNPIVACVLQTLRYLCMGMELCSGGDLFAFVEEMGTLEASYELFIHERGQYGRRPPRDRVPTERR